MYFVRVPSGFTIPTAGNPCSAAGSDKLNGAPDSWPAKKPQAVMV